MYWNLNLSSVDSYFCTLSTNGQWSFAYLRKHPNLRKNPDPSWLWVAVFCSCTRRSSKSSSSMLSSPESILLVSPFTAVLVPVLNRALGYGNSVSSAIAGGSLTSELLCGLLSFWRESQWPVVGSPRSLVDTVGRQGSGSLDGSIAFLIMCLLNPCRPLRSDLKMTISSRCIAEPT